jgi:hypothetical protein
MHDELGHRRAFCGRGCEIEIADHRFIFTVTVERHQVLGAVVRKFAQHLVADGSDAVCFPRRRDQLPDPALVLVGEAGMPADRRSREVGDI